MTLTRLAGALGALALALTGGTAAAHAPTPTSRGMLGPHQVATRDQVPWGQVGKGWFLTAIDQGPAAPGGGIDPHHQLLDLVDPLGGRYQMLKTDLGPHGRGGYQLADWSPDGQIALLLFGAGTAKARAVQVDLRYGTRHVTPLGADVASVGLGHRGAVYASEFGTRRGEDVVRIEPDGTRRLVVRHTDGLPLPTPDGSRLVAAPQASTSHKLRLVTSDGRVVRTLAVPHHCSPVRWWSRGVVMASCWTRNTSRLYAVPVDGSTPHPISAYHGRHSRDLGDIDARRLDGTTWLEASGPCGYVFLARQHADGTATQVPLPHARGNVYLLGTQGHDLVLQHGVSCDGGRGVRSAITHYDPQTGVDTVVALLPVDEAYDAVRAFGERRQLVG